MSFTGELWYGVRQENFQFKGSGDGSLISRSLCEGGSTELFFYILYFNAF